MAEVKKPLVRLEQGQIYVAGENGAYVIEQDNTHADLIRYMVNDVGYGHLMALIEIIVEDKST